MRIASQRIARAVFIAFALLLLIAPKQCLSQSSSQGDKLPLMVELDISSSTNRNGGPISLLMNVNYFGNKAGIAGDLKCQVVTSNGGVLVTTYLFEDLFITRGEQVLQFLVQPPTSGVWQPNFDFYPTFVTDDGRAFALQEQVLRLPGVERRSCVITVATGADEVLAQRDNNIASQFVLESHMPEYRISRPDSRSVVTLSRPMSVQNFPNHPLDHCVSDLVILRGNLFSKLSDRQGRALLAWCRAGGSVAIFLDEGERLASDRSQLLNEFLNADAESPLAYQLSDGTLQFANRSTEAPLLRHCGLGRVVLGGDANSSKFDNYYSEKDVRRMFIHLWKVRKEQQAEILNSSQGEWSLEPARRYTVLNNLNYSSVNDPGVQQFIDRFRSTPTGGGTGLLEETFPEGMQMLPLWMMGVTLFLYILAIGPLDYILLGSLGLRKYTWVFFPVVTVLFTAGAILSANYKMKGNDDGGRVVIRDITDQGLIARENELVTIVPSSSGEMAIDAKRELVIPVDPYQLGVSYRYRSQGRPSRDETPPLYRGRFPVDAQLVQRVYKWSTEMVRKVRIPSKATKEDSGFDWTQTINPIDHGSHLDLVRRIQAAFGEEVHAQLIRRNGSDKSSNRINLCGRSSIFVDPFDSYDAYGRPTAVRLANGQVIVEDETYTAVSFLTASALRQEAGIYSVVSQLSPKCDDYLEDLPILDSSDEKTWLLIIAVKDGNNWDIYRQLIRNEKPK